MEERLICKLSYLRHEKTPNSPPVTACHQQQLSAWLRLTFEPAEVFLHQLHLAGMKRGLSSRDGVASPKPVQTDLQLIDWAQIGLMSHGMRRRGRRLIGEESQGGAGAPVLHI